jgi:hypothetical protein
VISDVPLTGVFVDDQDAALDFYTNKLGLEKLQDAAYGADARWIEVSPAGAPIRIVLKKAERDYEKAMVGRSEGAPVLVFWAQTMFRRLTSGCWSAEYSLSKNLSADRGASRLGSWTRMGVSFSCSKHQPNSRVPTRNGETSASSSSGAPPTKRALKRSTSACAKRE